MCRELYRDYSGESEHESIMFPGMYAVYPCVLLRMCVGKSESGGDSKVSKESFLVL